MIQQKAYDFVVVGAGIAGVSAVMELRTRRPEASILLVSGEPEAPYKRTKLSKVMVKGYQPGDFDLFDGTWHQSLNLGLVLAHEVTALDPKGRKLSLNTGEEVAYKTGVLLALGAQPRIPVGYPQVKTWYPLRTRSQLDEILKNLPSQGLVEIVGCGVLGVEMAEQMVLRGLNARLVQRHPLPLHRDLTEEGAHYLKSTLESQGIEMGKSLNSDTTWALVAAGTEPPLALAQAAGLKTDQGILVDSHFQTSSEGVWAAGDVCQTPDGRICHLWHEAEYQGKLAAQFMTGRTEGAPPLGFRMKMEVFGQYFFSMNKPDELWWDREEYRRGHRYQCFFYSYERLAGVVMINDKDRAKTYEQAVREHWERSKVHEILGPF